LLVHPSPNEWASSGPGRYRTPRGEGARRAAVRPPRSGDRRLL